MANHIAIILVKTWWKLVEWCRRYFTFFLFFSGDSFSTWKMGTKLCDNLHFCRIPFIAPSIVIIIRKKNLQLVEQFARKLTIRDFYSTWKMWEMKQNCGKKINLNCRPHTALKIRWNFTTMCSRLWNLFRYEILTFQYRDLENVGQGYDIQHSQWRHSMTYTWFPI